MLVLSRKVGERIRIGNGIVIIVLGMRGSRVRLAFEAPAEISIHREEVHRRFDETYNMSPKCAPVTGELCTGKASNNSAARSHS